MAHDFDQDKYNQGITKYRKYQSDPSDCRGLMDYVDDGVGWSKCSARDFSRYITYGGRRKPCLAGNYVKDLNLTIVLHLHLRRLVMSFYILNRQKEIQKPNAETNFRRISVRSLSDGVNAVTTGLQRNV